MNNSNTATQTATQTANDYKEYFSSKFISLFKSLVQNINDMLSNNNNVETKTTNEQKNMLKILELIDKLNYEKIMLKMSDNNKLAEITNMLLKLEMDDGNYFKFFNNKEKYWTLIPSFNLNQILLQIPRIQHNQILSQINNLHTCAVTYKKVIEQIKHCESENKDFNPFETVGNVNNNMDIQTLFNGVEVKNIDAYEMIMSTLINNETNNKMDEYMNNIKESDVNEAAAKLNDVLHSEDFKGNKQTSKLLSEMLTNIQSEVINLKNVNTQNTKGKQGVEQLLGIAQKVAGNMMNKINDSNVSVLDIWDATSSLAKNTIQSDALNVVDNLIRSNIVSSMNAKYQEAHGENVEENNSGDSNSNV